MPELNDSKSLYDQICTRLQGKPPEINERIAAHVRAKHPDYTTLPAFATNGADEAEKVGTLKEILVALLKHDLKKPDPWAGLKGSVAKAQVHPEPPKVTRDTLAMPEPYIAQPAPIPVPKPKPPAPEAAPTGSVEEHLRAILAAVGAPKQQVEINEDKIKDIVLESLEGLDVQINEAVAEAIKASDPIPDIDKVIEQALAKLPARRIEVATPTTVLGEISGVVHYQFEQVLRWLNAGVQIWLYGGTGNGKTHLMYQIAKATGRSPYVISMDETMTVGRLIGYMSATGTYVPGLAFKAFRDGGLVVFDESDLSAVALAAVNAMTSNAHFLFPNGEVIERHKDCQFVCLANTKGAGAVGGYVTRVRMDAATLDRYACIEFHADEAMERSLATGRIIKSDKAWSPVERTPEQAEALVNKWVDYVHKARKTVGGSVIISQRCVINGAKAIRAGIPIKEIGDALLFKLCSTDTVANIKKVCGELSET